jgi:hypothetical protein
MSGTFAGIENDFSKFRKSTSKIRMNSGSCFSEKVEEPRSKILSFARSARFPPPKGDLG